MTPLKLAFLLPTVVLLLVSIGLTIAGYQMDVASTSRDLLVAWATFTARSAAVVGILGIVVLRPRGKSGR